MSDEENATGNRQKGEYEQLNLRIAYEQRYDNRDNRGGYFLGRHGGLSEDQEQSSETDRFYYGYGRYYPDSHFNSRTADINNRWSYNF